MVDFDKKSGIQAWSFLQTSRQEIQADIRQPVPTENVVADNPPAEITSTDNLIEIEESLASNAISQRNSPK
jgi:hypothetical protein